MMDKEVKEVIEIMNDAKNVDDLRINFINYEKHSQVGISIKEIIDILNYQQAEIEVLVEDTLCLRDTLEENESLRAEIEKHNNNCENCGAKTRMCIENLQNSIAEKQAEIERLTINMNAFGLCNIIIYGDYFCSRCGNHSARFGGVISD